MHSDQLTATQEPRADGVPNPRLLTAHDVAAMLGVTPAWVYEQSRLGRIPTITLGRFRRYRYEAILQWIGSIER